VSTVRGCNPVRDSLQVEVDRYHNLEAFDSTAGTWRYARPYSPRTDVGSASAWARTFAPGPGAARSAELKGTEAQAQVSIGDGLDSMAE